MVMCVKSVAGTERISLLDLCSVSNSTISAPLSSPLTLLATLSKPTKPTHPHSIQASSHSPRLILEFKNCSPPDVLAFNRAGAVSELEGCLASGGLTEFYKVVDYENVNDGKGVIAGLAVWGWDEAVRIPPSLG